MRGPERRRLFWRRGAEAVFIGRRGPVLDAGGPLETPQRLLPGRQRQPDQRQEGDDQREPEAAEQHAMQQRRQVAPQLEQRERRERRRRPGRARATPPRCARQAAQASSGARVRSKRLGERAILSLLRRGLLRSKNGSHRLHCLARGAWGHEDKLGSEAGESEAYSRSVTRLKASWAAAPWPACRHSRPWPRHAVAVAGDQHLGHQQPRIIFGGEHRAIGAGRHHGNEIAGLKFR